MGKLTGRTAISTNIDENLLIHVVDTTGTPASYKATLSQLYGVFPKNSSAGASDVNYLARWTADSELGKGIVQDNGSGIGIGSSPSASTSLIVQRSVTAAEDGIRGQITVAGNSFNANAIWTSVTTDNSSRSITSLSAFRNDGINVGATDTVVNAYGFYLGGHTGSGTITNSYGIYQNGTDKNYFGGQLQLNHTAGTAGQYLKSVDTNGNAEWADVVGGVQVSGTPVNNQVAVWTNSDTIEGDSNLTWNGSNLEVNLGNEYSRVNADYFINLSESDNANLFLYSKSAGTTIGSEIIFGRWNGTVGSESPLIDNQLISAQTIKGSYDSANPTNIVTGAQIQVRAAGAWTTSNYGVVYTIDTATEGTTTVTERFRIDSDGSVKIKSQVYSSIANTVTPSAGAATIDWNNGNMQVLDLQTGGNITTFTINNPKAGASYFIKIIQGGSNTITWPAAVKWAENDTYAGSVGAGDIDAVALTYDGTNYLANYSLDYQ